MVTRATSGSDRAQEVAAAIHAEIRALAVQNTPNTRALRPKHSRMLKRESPTFILDVARELLKRGHRGFTYELIRYHRAAFRSLGEKELWELGQGMDSWWAVDSFARILAGPAWLNEQVPDGLIHGWARSPDRWWRRAALVSTVALNMRSHGGKGDVPRTLRVCQVLASDHDDMVAKAMSWALRELVVHDPGAVDGFLKEHEQGPRGAGEAGGAL
ncbi:TPA: hypothetical protein DCY65_00500 [Candidatus Acetothermia bacterium]|nr:hypothetical protein [Candidatus Acetothermia bacterium]